MGSGGGSLQDHIAGLDLCQYIVGDGLALSHTVFDGQALDLLDNDGAGGHFVSQQLLQHTGGMLGDDGADAVAVHNTDGHHFLGGEVGLGGIHVCDSVLLLFQQLLKGLAGLLDIHYWPPSLV